MSETIISPDLIQKDFFISYTAVDEEIAEWVAFCLEDAGYQVIFQKWDFRPGNNFVLLMNKALIVAKRTIAILSTAFEEALFTQPEWAVIFSDDPKGDKRRLIPVRIMDFRPKGLLRDIIYIDLVPHLKNGDTDGARMALINGVREGRAKPQCEAGFPSCTGSDGR